MGENIIDLICNSCSCDKTEAQEYLDSELQYLHELQDVDDLRCCFAGFSSMILLMNLWFTSCRFLPDKGFPC